MKPTGKPCNPLGKHWKSQEKLEHLLIKRELKSLEKWNIFLGKRKPTKARLSKPSRCCSGQRCWSPREGPRCSSPQERAVGLQGLQVMLGHGRVPNNGRFFFLGGCMPSRGGLTPPTFTSNRRVRRFHFRYRPRFHQQGINKSSLEVISMCFVLRLCTFLWVKKKASSGVPKRRFLPTTADFPPPFFCGGGGKWCMGLRYVLFNACHRGPSK